MDEREQIQMKGRQMGVEFVDLERLVVSPDMAGLVPEHLARRYQVFPVHLKGNQLTLAMHDPLNVIALDDIRLATGFDLFPVIAIKRDIQKLLDDEFGESPGFCEISVESATPSQLDDCLYQVVVSERGKLVLQACPDATSSRSVRFSEKPDGFHRWVDFVSAPHSWLLLPTGQRIVLDLNRGELLPNLPDDLDQKLLAVEKEWTLATLERLPAGVCLNKLEETALILNTSHGWQSDVHWLQSRLEKQRNAHGGAHRFPLPGDCSATSAASVKFVPTKFSNLSKGNDCRSRTGGNGSSNLSWHVGPRSGHHRRRVCSTAGWRTGIADQDPST